MSIYFKFVKREEYLKAWQVIWEENKEEFKKDWRMKHVSPFRFNKLATEIDNYCVIAYDGVKPIGVFGMILVKNNRLLGKQIVLSPKYRGQRIGIDMIKMLEDHVKEKTTAEEYTIVCLDTTAGIYMKHKQLKPFKGPMKFTKDGIGYEYYFKVPLRR